MTRCAAEPARALRARRAHRVREFLPVAALLAALPAAFACQTASTPDEPMTDPAADATVVAAADTTPPPSPAMGAVVNAGGDAALGDDAFELNSAAIVDDRLEVSVSYGGGCAEHEFTLVLAEAFRETFPLRLPVDLRHEANGDACEAWLTTDYVFDLTLVRTRYREGYGSGPGSVILQLEGVGPDSLLYEFPG